MALARLRTPSMSLREGEEEEGRRERSKGMRIGGKEDVKEMLIHEKLYYTISSYDSTIICTAAMNLRYMYVMYKCIIYMI